MTKEQFIDFMKNNGLDDELDAVLEEYANVKFKYDEMKFLSDKEILQEYCDFFSDYSNELREQFYHNVNDNYDYENKWEEKLMPLYTNGSLNTFNDDFDVDEKIKEFVEENTLPYVMDIRNKYENVVDKYFDYEPGEGLIVSGRGFLDSYSINGSFEVAYDFYDYFINDVKSGLAYMIENRDLNASCSSDISHDEFKEDLVSFWNNASDRDKIQFEKNVEELNDNWNNLNKCPNFVSTWCIDDFYSQLPGKILEELNNENYYDYEEEDDYDM